MMDIKIGDIVTSSNIIHKTKDKNFNTVWTQCPDYYLPDDGILTAIFLGWTTVFEGHMEDEDDEYGYKVGSYFVQDKIIRMSVLQPIDKSGRYRKPVHALPEDVQRVLTDSERKLCINTDGDI